MLTQLKDKDFWASIRNDESYDFLLKEVNDLYQAYSQGDIPASKYSDYKIYFNSGSRTEYEDPYFYKRKRLAACTIMCMLYPEQELYLNQLQDVIWAICDEYCWALPAHMNQNETNDNTLIDLFSAETGYALSEIRYMLSDRLEPVIQSRIQTEIHRRIIDSFLHRTFWWETVKSNWAAVCAGSVGVAFMYECPEKFYDVKPRLDTAMDSFLSSFKEDGVCREGIGYWEYGFGFFVCYSDMLNRFSKGQFNAFADKKIRAISAFMPALFLQDNCTVSFADGSSASKYNLGLAHYLKGCYGDEIVLPPIKYHSITDHCGRWCYFVRTFLFYNPQFSTESQSHSTQTHYFKDSAWYIQKNNVYGFAAKAGDNDEPHNHNDVGSFLLAAQGRQVLCDLGAGRYTRQYFNLDTRYSILCNSSLGHNVPIIDGMPQKEGAKFCGSMQVKDNQVQIDFASAYDVTELTKLQRTFTLDQSSIRLTDTFGFDGAIKPVTERFVTLLKPIVADGTVTIDNVQLCFDSAKYQVNVTQMQHENHQNVWQTVYLIDFTIDSAQSEFTLFINIQ